MIHARKDYQRIQDPTGLIPENEPVFLLRGQDITTPDAIECWADLQEDPWGRLACMARMHAETIRRWQRVNVVKQADITSDQEKGQL
jgi:hypothetical protein